MESFDVASVHMSKSYDDATKRLATRSFDCIIVDNMTSKKNGLMLAKYIRQLKDEKLQAVPIILCTSYTGLQSVINARDAGITEILAKPVSPSQIMEKMINAFFNQRDFINSDIYSGPDRRRRVRDYNGASDRRNAAVPLSEVEENTTDTHEEDE